MHFAMPTSLRRDQYVIQIKWASFANTRTAHLGERDLLAAQGGSSMSMTKSSYEAAVVHHVRTIPPCRYLSNAEDWLCDFMAIVNSYQKKNPFGTCG